MAQTSAGTLPRPCSHTGPPVPALSPGNTGVRRSPAPPSSHVPTDGRLQPQSRWENGGAVREGGCGEADSWVEGGPVYQVGIEVVGVG